MSQTGTLIERTIRERIILVGVALGGESMEEVESHLDELALLVATAGAEVVGRVVQRRGNPDPATYIGKGKATELAELSLTLDSDTTVFDDELSPAQQRNLEKILGRTAIDRTAVILDIFGQNASTLEGRAQVELALLRYRLPRLRGRGTSLSRQGGGIGARQGGGETKLEVDRRRILKRMTKLEAELKELTGTRRNQRKARARSRLSTISLVGYTNAGKSSVLNRLTDAGVLVQDRLFATLDPRTRRLDLPGGEPVLLSDTVGFVRKLPTQLVQAFRSTLEVVAESDLLVHVVDASAANPIEQIEAVRTVLDEIGAGEVPELMAFNKADLRAWNKTTCAAGRRKALGGNGGVVDAAQVVSFRSLSTEAKRLVGEYPGSVAVSALTGEGIEALVTALADRLRAMNHMVELLVPYDRGEVVAAIHREGEVVVEQHEDRATRLRVRLDGPGAARFADFVVPAS